MEGIPYTSPALGVRFAVDPFCRGICLGVYKKGVISVVKKPYVECWDAQS